MARGFRTFSTQVIVNRPVRTFYGPDSGSLHSRYTPVTTPNVITYSKFNSNVNVINNYTKYENSTCNE